MTELLGTNERQMWISKVCIVVDKLCLSWNNDGQLP